MTDNTRSSATAGPLSHVRPWALALLLVVAGTTCRDTITAPKLREAGDSAFVSGSGSLKIDPALDTVLIGEIGTLTAYSTNGSPISKQVIWSSSDTSVAGVSSSGFATANVVGRKTGFVSITATSGNKTAFAQVFVRPVPVRAVTVVPDSVSLQQGDSLLLVATPRDSVGNPLAGRMVTWKSLDTAVASVDFAGKAIARTRGLGRIVATVEGITDTVPVAVRKAQLTMVSISTVDSANVGDTLTIVYTIVNQWDAPNADSVIVRVGYRNAYGTVLGAVRRALPHIGGGATIVDTARVAISSIPDSSYSLGAYRVVAYVDCEGAGTDVVVLTSCLAPAGTSGVIPEGNESDNWRAASFVLRRPELVVSNLVSPDSAFMRTTITASVTITNTGSATPTGFDVIIGLWNVFAHGSFSTTVVRAAPMGTGESRVITAQLAIPTDIPPQVMAFDGFQIVAFADCPSAVFPARPDIPFRECITGRSSEVLLIPEVPELDRRNNIATRDVKVATNIVRVVTLPDSIAFTALGDTARLTATAYDRGGAVVPDAVFAFQAFSAEAAVLANGPFLRAMNPGTALVIVSSEGRADTTAVSVVQQPAQLVLTPSEALLFGFGDTTIVDAAVVDRNGSPIRFAPVSWTSLDPSIASVQSLGGIFAKGKVMAQGVGTARIVASHGVLSDTLVVTVQPLSAPSHVVGSPDSALVSIGGAPVPYTAVLVDESGSPVPNPPFTWASLDPAIVSVAGNGASAIATPLTVGTGRIVATSGAVADTMVLFVNPAGYTHRWLGTASGWEDRFAWFPHQTPDSTISVYIPSAGAFAPVVSGTSSVHSISLGPSVTIAGSGPYSALRAHGSVDAAGRIATWLEMMGTGTLRGQVANLTISGPVTLIGRTVTDLTGISMPAGDLILNGHTLVAAGDFAVSWGGQLHQTNPADSLIVGNDAQWTSFGSWNFRSHLTAGVMLVGRHLRSIGPDSAFSSNGTHKIVFTGSGTHEVFATDTLGALNDVDVNGTLAVMYSTGVRGRMRLFPGSVVTIGQPDVQLRFHTSLPIVGQGNYQIENTALVGNVTLTQNYELQGLVTVAPGGTLTLGSHTLDVDKLQMDGALVMNHPADTLATDQLATFSGNATLTAGTLLLRGGLQQTSGRFAASGTHTTVFAPFLGQNWGPVTFADTTPNTRLQNVRVLSGASPQMQTAAHIFGKLTLDSGSGLVQYCCGFATNDAYTVFHTQLPDAAPNTYYIVNTTIGGDVVMTRDFENQEVSGFPTMVRVVPGGSLRLNGHTLRLPTATLNVLGGFGSTPPGRLIMDNPADTVFIGTQVSFGGATTLTAGTLIIAGNFNYVPGAEGAFTASGTHTTVINGTSQQLVTMFGASEGSTYFNNLRLENPQEILTSEDLAVRGKLFASNSALRSPGNRRLFVANGMDVAGLTLEGVSLDVSGGQITRFDSVSFNSPTGQDQPFLRLRNVYTSQPLTLNQVSFLGASIPGRFWIDADDTDPSDGILNLTFVSPQAADGPAKTRAGGAVINWRLP